MHLFKVIALGSALFTAVVDASTTNNNHARGQLSTPTKLTRSHVPALISGKKKQDIISPRALFGRQEEECAPGEFLCPNGGCCEDDTECFGENECCPIGSSTCGDWGCYAEPEVICCNGWACPKGTQCANEEGLCVEGTETTPTSTPTPTPTLNIKPRNCGGVTYTSDNIEKAMNEGFQRFKSGEGLKAANGRKYPKQFGNIENINFGNTVASPWYEFPILASGELFETGGDQGPDRVIFNNNGEFTSVITHTGAAGNNFVNCDEEDGGAKFRRAAEATSTASRSPSMATIPSSTASTGTAARVQSSITELSSLVLLFLAVVDFLVF